MIIGDDCNAKLAVLESSNVFHNAPTPTRLANPNKLTILSEKVSNNHGTSNFSRKTVGTNTLFHAESFSADSFNSYIEKNTKFKK